jgi:hypothetical protein
MRRPTRRAIRTVAVIAVVGVISLGGYLAADQTVQSGSSSLSVSLPVQLATVSGYMKQYVTLSWVAVPDVDGYSLYRDGVLVSTAGPGAISSRFYLQPGQHTLRVDSIPSGTTTTAPTATTGPTTTTAAATTAPTTTAPPPTTTTATGYYSLVNFDEAAFPVPGWDLSTFFPTGASWARVTDPLGVEGQVLQLQAVYSSQLPTDYSNAGLQQAAISVSDKSLAHAALGDDTWYRDRFMFPTGDVFSNGFTNFIEEHHTNEVGPKSPGMFAYGDYPLTTGGTTVPKLVWVVRSGDVNNPTERFYPGGTNTVETSSGIPIQTNHWYDSVTHFKWRTDSSGLFEWYLDGKLIVSASGPTYYTEPTELLGWAVYNYRYNVTGDETIDYGLLVDGPTRASVGG